MSETMKNKQELAADEKQSASDRGQRRKALKRLAVGGAVSGVLATPGKWTSPVVNSVMLPAHAETTDSTGSSTTGIENITYYDEITELVPEFSASAKPSKSNTRLFATGTGVDNVIDVLVPEANAVDVIYNYFYHLCIKLNNGVVNVELTEVESGNTKPNLDYITVWSGTGSIGSAIPLVSSCTGKNQSIVVTNPTPADTDFALTLYGDLISNNLPKAPCKTFVANCEE